MSQAKGAKHAYEVPYSAIYSYASGMTPFHREDDHESGVLTIIADSPDSAKAGAERDLSIRYSNHWTLTVGEPKKKDKLVVLKEKKTIEASCLDPGTSLGGGDDYSTYGYLEWSSYQGKWVGYAGGTSSGTGDPYENTYKVEDSDILSSYVKDYLERQLREAGLEDMTDFKAFSPLAEWNTEKALDYLAKKGKIMRLGDSKYELSGGTVLFLEKELRGA